MLVLCYNFVMNSQIRDQYNSLYSLKENVFGGGKPIEEVCNITKYTKDGTVLDIGGGEGRNAIYLAEQGFDVSVIDISKVGIDRLKNKTKQKGLKINTDVVDILEEDIKGEFDVIINSFVLHHMNESDAVKIIKDSQKHTNKGGINILSTFSNQGDLYERNIKSNRFYPSEDFIRELYKGWDTKELSTKEIITHARNKKGERIKNYVLSAVLIKI